MARLSDRGFTSSRGLSYTFSGTATELDTALPITHNLGALPSSLELWVEQGTPGSGEWEKHDAGTYLVATATSLVAGASALAATNGGPFPDNTNIRIVAAAGAVALSVAEASVSQAGIVSTGTQSFGGIKAFGTSSATTLAPLHAKASSSFSLNLEEDASNVAGILFSRHASPNAGSVSITANSQSSGNYLAFTTGSGEALRITSSGNVGIGTSSPSTVISGTTTVLEVANSNLPLLALHNTGVGGKKWSTFSDTSGQYRVRNEDDSADAITASSTGAVTLGASTPSQSHTLNGGVLWGAYQGYTGGSTRTAVTDTPISGTTRVYTDSFTNLSTTEWDLGGGLGQFGEGIYFFKLQAVNNDRCYFQVIVGFDNGVASKYTVTGEANCSIAQSGAYGNILTITNIGDGRTYTVTFDGGFGTGTIKTSSLATGTTTVRWMRISL